MGTFLLVFVLALFVASPFLLNRRRGHGSRRDSSGSATSDYTYYSDSSAYDTGSSGGCGGDSSSD